MDTGENLMDGILSLWQQPSVLLFLTLAVYALALILRARTGYLLLNPVLISTVTLIAYLKILDIDYAVYHDAAQFIDFWLKPAVVALAVPLYQNRQKIFSQWLPVIVSQLAGSVTGIITGMYFAKWLGAEREVVLSLAAKSVTNPIAIEITRTIGGIPAITAATVIGKDDDRLGQRICAAYTGSATVPDILDALADAEDAGRIAHWQIPKELRVVAALPQLGPGKVDRAAVKELF